MAKTKRFVSHRKRKEMIDREEDKYIKAAKCNVQFDENDDFSDYEKGADGK